jgi:hypothetical protein
MKKKSKNKKAKAQAVKSLTLVFLLFILWGCGQSEVNRASKTELHYSREGKYEVTVHSAETPSDKVLIYGTVSSLEGQPLSAFIFDNNIKDDVYEALKATALHKENGKFEFLVEPGVYDFKVAEFAYDYIEIKNLEVKKGTSIQLDCSLKFTTKYLH